LRLSKEGDGEPGKEGRGHGHMGALEILARMGVASPRG